MSTREQQAIAAWKTAETQARAAEQRLKAAWDLYEERKGELPSHELVAEAARLRQLAREQLDAALQLMGRKV